MSMPSSRALVLTTAKKLPAEELRLDAPALFGSVARAIRGETVSQTAVDLPEPVRGQLIDELGGPPGFGEADRADLIAHELGQQIGRLGGGTAANVELVLHEGRLPEDDLAGAHRSTVAADVRRLHPGQVGGVLARVADGGRGQDEARLRSVERGDPPETA